MQFWLDFLVTLSNIWNEVSDNIKSCLEWYLCQCSQMNTVWAELSDNLKYRLNSVAAFSTAWIEFSHSICHEFSDNTRHCLPWIFTSFSRPVLNLMLFPWTLWIYHWIYVKILLLSILIMRFGFTGKVFLLTYLCQYLSINYKVFLWIYFLE